MSQYNIVEIMPEVTLIEDADTNIYVVEGERSAMVIDTGYGIHNLKSAVDEITENKPIMVFFTHGHIDHAFGGHYFDKVYMSKEEMPVYEKHAIYRATMKEWILKEYGITQGEFEAWTGSKPERLEFAAQNDIFDIGGNLLEVISLKGHTPGSIGLLDRKHRILFSGDGLINHVWMQLPESTTIAEYLETLEALEPYKKEFDIIYMGHRRAPKPVAFIEEMKLALKALLDGAEGKLYDNPIASGMIYKRNGCEVVYNPDRIK